ncbi:MAG TPA: fluoride efflux transporter CrcB [Flavobacteriales bacterium]
MNVWLAVFIGGGIGSLMRFGITRLLLACNVKGAFPWATLAANVVSACLLAWLVLRMQERFEGQPVWKAFIAVGICGGFSTFSTFSYENFLLIREGQPWMAVANIGVNVVACLAVFFILARTP